jgi:hypothetical protein
MSERALYAYCVIPAGERPPLAGLSGVDPASGVELLTHDPLSALVSSVSLEEFGAEALKRNLEDLSWLERTARAHDAVIERALAGEAVVPMRLCTIFTDEAHVHEMLERERDVLLQALGRLRHHAEWGVKVLADRAALENAARERAQAPVAVNAEAGAPGHAYLARKKLERSLREQADAFAEGAIEDIHTRLAEQATTTTLLPPQNPDLSRRSGEMVLNAAYLVHRERARAFTALAEDLREQGRELGLELELTGPWAPYNFVTGRG